MTVEERPNRCLLRVRIALAYAPFKTFASSLPPSAGRKACQPVRVALLYLAPIAKAA
jgi:hypothetical protein